MNVSRRVLLTSALAIVVAATLGGILLGLLLSPPPSQVEPVATIRLKLIDPPPEVAYAVTQVDISQFPIIGEVLLAFDDPSCCEAARIIGGTLFYDVAEEEGLAVTEYLRERYEALNPPPGPYEVALEYQLRYLRWSLLVT